MSFRELFLKKSSYNFYVVGANLGFTLTKDFCREDAEELLHVVGLVKE